MQSLNARPPFLLRTLGELSLVGPGGAPIPFRRKELLLLAYVARRDGGTASRAELAALLWGDRDDRLARVSLRQAIFRLRSALGDAIVGEGETVGIEPSRLRVDASEFERFSGAGELEAAVAAWTGEFLAGDDPPGNEALRDWAATERDTLHRQYVRALERLVERAVAAGRWGDAVAAAERWSETEPLDAEACRRLAEALRLAGDPAAALARIDALEARRRSELGSEVPPRLATLRDELRREVALRDAAAARGATRTERPAVGQPVLTGRGAEFAELLAAWRDAARGSALLLLVTGAEGSGRSRLLEELLRTVRAEGALALGARGYAADRGTPWATARSLLARLADAPGLAGLPPTALAQLATVVPAIRHQFASLPEVAADEWAITEAVRLALEEVAVEVPVAVAIDDLPLADAATRRLVLAVARRLPVPGLLLVATARDEDLAAMPEARALLDVAGSRSVALRPLSLRETELLVWSMLPLAGPDRQALVARLHADTGGVPGHVVAWVEDLVATRTVAPEPDGRWRLEVDAGTLALPARVREAHARRESPDSGAAPPAGGPAAGGPAAGGPAAGAPAAVAVPGSAGRKRRVLALAAGLAGGIAAAIAMAAFVTRGHGPRSSNLDASLVAVAPFDAADPELGLWRQGVVDVLARHLDGAGPLRTVPPTVVVRRFAGHSDAASARALGERTNAGLVVYGGLVRAGADSVRIDATLLDARRGRTLGDVRVQGPLARMDRVLDSLSVALLREMARTRPVGAVRASGVASVPLPALKAFLAAEQHYRAGAYDSATAEAARAVALDSTFALAWHRLGALVQFGGDGTTGARLLLRAGRLNRGLAPRDSIIVALDSVRGAGDLAGLLAPREGVPTRFMETYLSRARQGTRLYPDDPELWYTLGEGLTHIGVLEGATRADQIAAYERAIALDSAFLPTYPHAVGALLASGNVARARHHLQTVRALARGKSLRSAADIVLRVVRPDGTADTAAFDAWLQAAPLADFEPVWAFLEDWPDSTEVALRMLRVARRRAETERPEMLAIVTPLLHSTLGYRGHLAEQRAMGATPAMVLQHAILGALPADSARAAAPAWLRGGLAELSRPEPLVWFAVRSDSASLTRYVQRVEAELGRLGAGAAGQSDMARRARYGLGAARAYLRLARRDTVGALVELRELSPRDCPANCTANHLLHTRLLVARGARAEARALVYRGSPGEGELPASPFDVIWQLERGRAAEEAEDLDRAVTAYTIAAGAWARADPPLAWWYRRAEDGRRRVQGWIDARRERR